MNKIIILILFSLLLERIFNMISQCSLKIEKMESIKFDKLAYLKDYFKNYSKMIHLPNHQPSTKRLNNCKKYWKNDLFPQISDALHWKKDDKIIKKYPIDRTLLTRRKGAYGLAGTFYRNLVNAYNNNWDYLLHIEDDAIPNQRLSNNQFTNLFYNSLINLPDDEGVYTYSLTIYCSKIYKNKKSTLKWKKYDSKLYTAGGTCILLTKKAIKKILSLKIFMYEIDDYLKDIFSKNFHFWYYDGPINNNGMFYGLIEQIGTDCRNRDTNIMKLVDN